MPIVILYYGPYEFKGRIKYRFIRLKGLAKLLSAINIPFELKRFQFWDRLHVEIEGQTVYTCKLTNMEFDGDGTDYTTVTAFDVICDAYAGVLRYYSRKDPNRLLYHQHSGAKCFPHSFDSMYLESFCRYQRTPGIRYHTSRDRLGDEEEQEYEEEQEFAEEYDQDDEDDDYDGNQDTETDYGSFADE